MIIDKDKIQDAKAIKLEAALNSMPQKELPFYVEQRILARMIEQVDKRQRVAHRSFSRLQWAMLTLGVVAGLFSSITFTNLAVRQPADNCESITGLYELSDPGILDLY